MSEGVASERAPGPRPGEPGALEERLAATLPRLRRYLARRRVPGEEPEDLAQEVLVRALRYRARFDPARELWPWLRRLAERVQSDRRAAGTRRQAPLSALAEAPGEPLARGSVGERLESREELARLLAALAPTEREALVRFHQRGQSVRTIATELGLPEGTVKSHLSRARRKLAGLPTEEPPRA